MKKQTLLFMPMVMTLASLTASPVYATNADHILINQIYGTGGKTECAVSHNFIELYNPTDTDISLADYEIHYNEKTLDLNDNDTVKAHSSYLIVGKEAIESTPALTIKDYDFLNEEFELSNKDNKIELMKNGEKIDGIQTNEKVSVTGIEGDSLTGLSKQKSARRKNFEDTDNNANDFGIVEYKGKTLEDIQSESVYPRSSKDGAWTQTPEKEPTQEPVEEQSIVNTKSVNGVLNYLGSYSIGAQNEDGGVAEIVKYNSDNQKMYLVSGQFQSVDIVSLKDTQVDQQNTYTLNKRLDIKTLASQHGFTCGDITSVDINTKLDIIAIAVQGAGYSDNGSIVLFDYDGNYITHFEAGCQPDMITFTKDGKYALTANEGEPREGYNGAEDPKGSITVLTLNEKDVTKSEAQTYDFSEFDSQRDQLVNNGVLLKKNTAPSVDLEPEYIAISSDNKKAYVSLQESNAVATFDLEGKKWQSIKGLGFKDYSVEGNGLDLNKDGQINIQNENVLGIYMPDGLASVTINGVDYILTPNEGDAREWADYDDIIEKKINGAQKNVELVNPSEFDGLDENKDYLFGGRSFSIFKADTMELVYDSGSDFGKIIAEKYPDIFNSNHKELGVDGRSNKKGPEPEDIKTLTIGNKTYAFIGLERAGGLMMYDITDPSSSKFVDYLNIRNMKDGAINNGSDLGAEGISVIEAKDSPTGYPMILVANEVSGTVSVMYLRDGYVSQDEQKAIQFEESIKNRSDELSQSDKEKFINDYDSLSDGVKSYLSNDIVELINKWKKDLETSQQPVQTETPKEETKPSTQQSQTKTPNTSDTTSFASLLTLIASSLGLFICTKKKGKEEID